ncbi:NAD-dependent epimerase/dehydratase family protein [Tengunoibacter tsumagoiensis]|uniref:UDP-glucose 4-epimerase n=1 Tax=Tengunoibacter tsumagoiensis TaxID=2014871 RepID=A0A402A2L3_9CHLR|nr:NAD-dependent epimerase/dehydratase family protein [Tengunoibacter tsumagoiensis]GCE13241.1 UDP-glucose 4-epimerase [Tengunoibacter tsumagoiensis]
MKIAITGGAGFIGSHLTKAYLDAGHEVVVIDTLVEGSRQEIDPRARFYPLDIRDGKLCRLLQQERPEIVSYQINLHHEYPTEQILTEADVHVRGLLNVLDSCVNAACTKIIFASGGNSLYGNVEASHQPIHENRPLNPQSAADISRAIGEWYIRYYTQQFGLPHTILRYANVYGEPERTRIHHPLSYFLLMLQAQQRPVIRGAGTEIRDHIFIDDVVSANLAVLQKGTDQTFHISSGEGYSLNELYMMSATALEVPEIEPIYLSGYLTEPTVCLLDNSRARQILHWQPQTVLREGIKKALERLHIEPSAKRPQPVAFQRHEQSGEKRYSHV